MSETSSYNYEHPASILLLILMLHPYRAVRRCRATTTLYLQLCLELRRDFHLLFLSLFLIEILETNSLNTKIHYRRDNDEIKKHADKIPPHNF